MEGQQILIALDSKNVAQKSPCFFLLSMPSLPQCEASEAGAEHWNLPKWRAICISFYPFLHQPPLPVSFAWLIFLGGELVKFTSASASFHTPPYPPPIPHGALRGPGSTFILDKSWVTNHLSLCAHPINHHFLVICMATLLCLAAQGVFWFHCLR